MKRKFVAFAACLFLSASILSAKSLVLTLANGTRMYYLLGEGSDPIMRFVDGKVTVDTDEYEFSDIRNFYISDTDDPNGIEQTLKEAMIEYNQNAVIINTDKPLPVSVYSTNGNEVSTWQRHYGDKTIIDMSPLLQGTYIIRIGDASLKIFKK